MRGFPKTLNTKEDYQYVREHFSREEWLPAWQNLLDTMRDWFFVRYLEENEEAPEGECYRVDEPQAGSDEKRRGLYEFRVNETCKLIRLGFTEDEVKAACQ